ncbi:Imm1 family immunity protein [Micromonospora tulbaghiae]|uniref:Imm1 family immunity protein n=1 Tax=Micromonospora tulbaghiae TaxID=479978 RepID=UPI0033A45371
MARVVVIIEGLPGEDVVECYVSDDRDVRCGERSDIAGLIERFDELRARGRGHVEVQASAESPVLTLGFTESAAVVHLMTGEDAISLLAAEEPASTNVQVLVLGDLVEFAADFLLDLERAWQVVEEFVRTGDPGRAGGWREL